jgi:uncharacterized membrane protein
MFINVIFIILGWYRRKRVPENERYVLKININITIRAGKYKTIKMLNLAIVITGSAIIIALIYILFSPVKNENFTEFYITGQNELAADYPEQLRSGEYGTVKLNVISNENQKTVYRIVIKVDGVSVRTITQVSLEYHEKWGNYIRFKADKPNDATEVEFLLFRDGKDAEPYRMLKLWVNVTP